MFICAASSRHVKLQYGQEGRIVAILQWRVSLQSLKVLASVGAGFSVPLSAHSLSCLKMTSCTSGKRAKSRG